jgi:hypothetical protein
MALESNIVTKIVGDEAIVDPTGPASPCVDDISIYQVTDQPGATYFWDFGPGATPATATTSEVAVSWSSFGYRNITVTVTTATCTANNFLEVFVSDSPVYCDDQPGVQFNPVTTPTEMMGYEIFPNPFNDRLQVRFEEALPGIYRIASEQSAGSAGECASCTRRRHSSRIRSCTSSKRCVYADDGCWWTNALPGSGRKTINDCF